MLWSFVYILFILMDEYKIFIIEPSFSFYSILYNNMFIRNFPINLLLCTSIIRINNKKHNFKKCYQKYNSKQKTIIINFNFIFYSSVYYHAIWFYFFVRFLLINNISRKSMYDNDTMLYDINKFWFKRKLQYFNVTIKL